MPATRFGHVKVLPFTVEKAAYLEADPDFAGCPTFRFSGWASLAVPDSDGEIVDVGFFDARLPEFLANPVMRWMHGHGDVAGKYLSIQPVEGRGYWADAVAIDFGRPEDKARLNMLRTGAVSSMSVGFDGSYTPEYGYYDEQAKLWHWTQNGRLLEISPCDIPACPGASIQLAKALGMVQEAKPEFTATKGDSTSLLANIAEEGAEEAAYQALYDLWEALVKTLEAIIATPGDKVPLFAQFGADLGAELTRRFAADTSASSPAASIMAWAKQAQETSPDATEEERVLSYLTRLSGAAEALRNFTRHASKEGGTPSAILAETAAIPIADLVEIVVKAGATLSAASLASVDAAITALCALREAATGQRLPAAEAETAACDPDEEKPKSEARVLRVIRTAKANSPAVRTLSITR